MAAQMVDDGCGCSEGYAKRQLVDVMTASERAGRYANQIASLKADLEKCRKAYGKLFNENAALQGEVDALKAKIEAITLWRRRW